MDISSSISNKASNNVASTMFYNLANRVTRNNTLDANFHDEAVQVIRNESNCALSPSTNNLLFFFYAAGAAAFRPSPSSSSPVYLSQFAKIFPILGLFVSR